MNFYSVYVFRGGHQRMRYTREMFLNLESVFFGMASNANKRFLMLGMKTACFKFNLNSPHQVFLSLIINKVARGILLKLI